MTMIHLPALLLALLALPVLAQPPRAPEGLSPASRAVLLKALSRGPAFTSNHQSYQLLPEAQAATRHPGDTSAQITVQRLGSGTVIETKGHFVVFRAATTGSGRLEQVDSVTVYPTAINTSNGNIGILPGTLVVRLKNTATAAAIATDHGLELVRSFPAINSAYYLVKPGQNLLAVASALSNDARVQQAEIEVLEHVRVPR